MESSNTIPRLINISNNKSQQNPKHNDKNKGLNSSLSSSKTIERLRLVELYICIYLYRYIVVIISDIKIYFQK